MIHMKRAYESPSRHDGLRILVERLWPRGLTKAKAKIDLWLKEVSPSPELRRWYGHDVARWEAFRNRYEAELESRGDLVELLRMFVQDRAVTFVYAAADEEHNSALVLKEYLER